MICSSVNLFRFIRPSFVRSDPNSFWRNFSGTTRSKQHPEEVGPSEPIKSGVPVKLIALEYVTTPALNIVSTKGRDFSAISAARIFFQSGPYFSRWMSQNFFRIALTSGDGSG